MTPFGGKGSINLRSRIVADGKQENIDQFGDMAGMLKHEHMPGSINGLQRSARDLAGKDLGKTQGGQFIILATDNQSRGVDGSQAIFHGKAIAGHQVVQQESGPVFCQTLENEFP